MKKAIIICAFLLQCFTIQAVEVVFRFDDFQLHSDSIQQRLLETFYDHRIPISLAVIPYFNDKPFFEEGAYLSLLNTMYSEGMVEIALHGLNHEHISKEGEIPGLSLQKQLDMISKGKHILDSLFPTVITFIPPFNAYDENTLKALEELEFECISSEIYAGHPLNSNKLWYYPETIDHPNKLIKAIEDNRNRNGIIILMFHHYDFDENFSMDDLDMLLGSIQNMKDVECLTFKMLCDRNTVSDASRVKANVEVNLLSRFLNTRQMLQSKSFTNTVSVCNLLIYVLMALLVILFGWFVLGISSKGYFIGAGIIMALSCIVVWWHLLTPWKSLAAILFVTITYVIANWLKDRKRR